MIDAPALWDRYSRAWEILVVDYGYMEHPCERGCPFWCSNKPGGPCSRVQAARVFKALGEPGGEKRFTRAT